MVFLAIACLLRLLQALHGEFRASGLRPRCIDEMTRRGIAYDMAHFDPSIALGAS